MSDRITRARLARENLSRALAALQSPGVPPSLIDAAEPVAAAMSALHRIEAYGDPVVMEYAPLALLGARRALGMLQEQPVDHPAVDQALESIASSLSLVHGMAAAVPSTPSATGQSELRAGQGGAPGWAPAPVPTAPAQPYQPAPAAPPQPRPREAAAPPQHWQQPSPVQEWQPPAQNWEPPTPAPEWQPPYQPAAQPQPPAPQPAAPGWREPTPQPAPAWHAPPHPWQQPEPGQSPHPEAPPPPWQQRGDEHSERPGAAAWQPPAPGVGPERQRPAQSGARPQWLGPAPQAEVPRQAPVASSMPQPAWAAPPAPTPTGASNPHALRTTSPSAMRVGLGSGLLPVPGAPSGHGDPIPIEANLGAHSASNFFKGLSGNDVVDSGGVFIATYQIPSLGQNLALRVSLPGGYEFEARGVVRWIRDAQGSSSQTPPGFGAQFTEISPEGRQLVYRYVRNREPLFHDDL